MKTIVYKYIRNVKVKDVSDPKIEKNDEIHCNVGPKIIPEKLTDEQVLFLTDILSTSLFETDIANVRPNDTAVVLGCLLAQKWAIYKGTKRSIAADCIDYRLYDAKTYNQVKTVNFQHYHNTKEYLKEITNGGPDAVIYCVGMVSVPA